VNLNVDFMGIKLKSPLVVASANTSATVEQILAAEENGAGAVSVKCTFIEEPYIGRYRQYSKLGMYSGMAADRRLKGSEGEDLIRAVKKVSKIPILGNLMGPGIEIDGWVKIAKSLERGGADALEVNVSCPNIGEMQQKFEKFSNKESRPMGSVMGKNPELVKKVVEAVLNSVKVPVVVKLVPGETGEAAKAALDAGAKGLTAINGMNGVVGADIYNGGKPLVRGVKKQTFGCISGPVLKPFALRDVGLLRRNFPNVSILGGGGLSNWKDTVEMIMFGATATSYCTELIWRGYEVLRNINKNLKKYMAEMGYNNISDFRGVAMNYITTPDALEYIDVVADINEEKCVNCGSCIKIPICNAISNSNGKTVVDKGKCKGCSVCVDVCPKNAIKMVEV